jgi:hypothetical protein
MSTYFRYQSLGWPRKKADAVVIAIAFGNVMGLVFLFLLLSFFLGDLLDGELSFPESLNVLPAVGFVLLWIAMWNLRWFSHLMQQADIELAQGRVILHLPYERKLHINLDELDPARVRKHAVPKANVLGLRVGTRMHVYFVSATSLPWYFHFVGLFVHRGFRGRGFFITSWHENYEELLNRLRIHQRV